MKAPKGGGVGMSARQDKAVRRRSPFPRISTGSQLNDTGYAARETVAFLKRLWPDAEPRERACRRCPVRVTGPSPPSLGAERNPVERRSSKTRADHRHHAVDALVVACTRIPGMTQRLARYWQAEDDLRTGPEPPRLAKPWATIRADAERAVDKIVVSHRVRKQSLRSAAQGDDLRRYPRMTSPDRTARPTGYFVIRKKVEELTMSTSREKRRDRGSCRYRRRKCSGRSCANGSRTARWRSRRPPFEEGRYPRAEAKRGRRIRKVRVRKKRRIESDDARSSCGYAEKRNNHHMAIYRQA